MCTSMVFLNFTDFSNYIRFLGIEPYYLDHITFASCIWTILTTFDISYVHEADPCTNPYRLVISLFALTISFLKVLLPGSLLYRDPLAFV